MIKTEQLELLVFAAKAAGVTVTEDWNPIDDSGQAFELAMALGFSIHKMDDTIIVEYDVEKEIKEIRMPHNKGNSFSSVSPHSPIQAARFAIVQAAAEIGKVKRVAPQVFDYVDAMNKAMDMQTKLAESLFNPFKPKK
jgi:hypothetical protein